MTSNCDNEVVSIVSELVDNVRASFENCASNSSKAIPYISSHRTPSEIGLTEYWNPTVPGIGGVFKSRFTDFLVHELTRDGKVVRLSDNDKAPLASWLVNKKSSLSMVTDDEKAGFEKYFDSETWKQLEELDGKDKDSVAIVEFQASEDKDFRTQQHCAIKTLWPSVISETITIDETRKLIRVMKQASSNRRRQFEQRWPGNQRFCHFVMYKEQLDTSAALSYLSRCLNLPFKKFQFAGMKDKRGCTTQRISADRISAEKIIDAVRRYNNPRSCIMVSDFSYEPIAIKLGDLAGNHFEVVLRNITNTKQVDTVCQTVRDFGFANYFGNQRFGTSKSYSTSDIGRLLLQCRWSDVIDAVIKSTIETKCDKTGEDERVDQVLKAWFERKDAAEAARVLPGPYRGAERQMLESLARNPSDLIGAIRRLPRNLIMMYGHAYQSLIWNRIVAKRISKYGNRAVLPGDLVCSDNCPVKSSTDTESDEYEEVYTTARYIEENETDNFNITDVVLPLPGFDVMLPKNAIKDWYEEMLQVDGVQFVECGRQMPELMLSGAYRPLMIKPSYFKWHLTSFEKHTDQINTTDRDIVKKTGEIAYSADHTHPALVLDFQLPSCSYASVLIWEISKSEECDQK